jgi:hypothetical protein
MLGREPIIITYAIVAVLQGIAILYYNEQAVDTTGWQAILLPIVTLVAGFIPRQKVASQDTLQKAGTNLAQVNQVADSPNTSLILSNKQVGQDGNY